MLWTMNKRKRPWPGCAARLLLALCCAAAPVLAQQPLPQDGKDAHLGVGSCASSQCHGAVRGFENSNIWRNEYRVWSREDAHARAYAVLRDKASKQMAQKLGIGDPTQAKICLDCHADNVPAAKRGRKFQLSDGIGCEACHGGAERWIESHTEKDVTHDDNVARGMYPTEMPTQRAALCQSCHYGDRAKFATHALMAAGHPRLSFELDTFTLTQVHYDIDDDYLKRKAFPGNVQTWAAGVAQNAGQNLSVIKGLLYAEGGMFPEIALFDCHACHHAMNDKRWSQRATTVGLPPGAIRFNDSALIMLYVIAEHVSPDDSRELLAATRALHKATLSGRDAVMQAADRLQAMVQRIQQKVIAHDYGNASTRAIRQGLFALGGKGEFRDYSGAEQAAMAVDLLTFALQEDTRFEAQVNRLYTVLKDEPGYHPSAFAEAMRAFGDSVRGGGG